MNSLLSLIVCIAMLMGAGTLPAVPEEQSVLTLQNICVSAGDERVELTPEARLTLSAAEDLLDVTLSVTGGESPILLAVRLEDDRMVLVPNSGRAFAVNAAAAEDPDAAETRGESAGETAAYLDACLECLSRQIAEGRAQEDIPQLLFEALSEVSGVEPIANRVTIDDELTLDGKTVRADVSLSAFYELLDELCAGSGATAELLKSGLQSLTKDDGSAFEAYAELDGSGSDQTISVEMIRANGEDIGYDRIRINADRSDEADDGEEPEEDHPEKGECCLEMTTREAAASTIGFVLNLSGEREEFAYETQIDLQGSAFNPKSVAAQSTMTDTKRTEAEAEDVYSRTADLNMMCVNGLWNAASNVSVVRSAAEAESEETDISVAYSESRDEDGIVTGAADIAITSGGVDKGVSFDLMQSAEAYADAFESLVEMELTESLDIPAMVFMVDLEELNAAIRSLFSEESIRIAAGLMNIDLSKVSLFGETEPAPAETIAIPSETEAAPDVTQTPEPTPEMMQIPERRPLATRAIEATAQPEATAVPEVTRSAREINP